MIVFTVSSEVYAIETPSLGVELSLTTLQPLASLEAVD